MKIVLAIFIIAEMLVVIAYIVAMIKNESVMQNRIKIITAIHDYNIDAIENGESDKVISFELMTDYEEDFKRWNDWSCENILPNWAFELVKPYLEKGERSNEKH